MWQSFELFSIPGLRVLTATGVVLFQSPKILIHKKKFQICHYEKQSVLITEESSCKLTFPNFSKLPVSQFPDEFE